MAPGLPPAMDRPHFIGIGGKWFGFGAVRSRALRDGMPAYERAIATAIAELVAARPVSR